MMYIENPIEGMKNHGLSKNVMLVLGLDGILCEKRSISYNKVVLPSCQLFILFYEVST